MHQLSQVWAVREVNRFGAWVSCLNPAYPDLFRYLDEQTYRYDFRQDNDFGRFERVSGQVEGRRVTYKKLTGKLRGKVNLKEKG